MANKFFLNIFIFDYFCFPFQNLQSHTRKKDSHRPKSHMVSDDPIVYASGDDWPTINIGTGTTLTDDEDLFDHEYGSGSGSGQGEDDINIGTGPGNPVVDIVLPDQGTGNREYFHHNTVKPV